MRAKMAEDPLFRSEQPLGIPSRFLAILVIYIRHVHVRIRGHWSRGGPTRTVIAALISISVRNPNTAKSDFLLTLCPRELSDLADGSHGDASHWTGMPISPLRYRTRNFTSPFWSSCTGSSLAKFVRPALVCTPPQPPNLVLCPRFSVFVQLRRSQRIKKPETRTRRSEAREREERMPGEVAAPGSSLFTAFCGLHPLPCCPRLLLWMCTPYISGMSP